jgi:glycosyltransferase involved in cell wall biosynthesis
MSPTQAPRTVVHFVDSESFGGCERIMLTLLSGLNRAEWRPVLFHNGRDRRLPDAAEQLKVPTMALPPIDRTSFWSALPEFSKALRKVNASVFHAHLNWPLACRHELLAARLARIPANVATSHLYAGSLGNDTHLKRKLQVWTVDRYMAVSEGIGSQLVSDFGAPSAKVTVIPNGIVIPAQASPPDAALRASWQGASNRPVVLALATLDARKGLDCLLTAACKVPNAAFVLAGDGPMRESLAQQAIATGIADRVFFLGHRTDIPSLLASCDLFVLPSLQEGLPLSVLEAMAASKPVIASRIPGTEDIVEHGISGVLVPPSDPDALALAITQALTDGGRRAQLGANGYQRVTRHFSADSMVLKVSDVYRQVLTPNHGN